MPKDLWIGDAKDALRTYHNVPLSDDVTMRVRWTAELSDETIADIKALFDQAYTKRSMWPYFMRCRYISLYRLVFTLHHAGGGVIATRSIGHVLPEDNYWQDGVVQAVGLTAPLAGGSYTVKPSARGKGYGALLFKQSNIWMRDHAKANIIFGDTVSRKALEIYVRNGAFVKQRDVHKLCAAFDCKTLDDFFAATRNLEEVPFDLGINYAWCFNDDIAPVLVQHGYISSVDTLD